MIFHPNKCAIAEFELHKSTQMCHPGSESYWIVKCEIWFHSGLLLWFVLIPFYLGKWCMRIIRISRIKGVCRWVSSFHTSDFTKTFVCAVGGWYPGEGTGCFGPTWWPLHQSNSESTYGQQLNMHHVMRGTSATNCDIKHSEFFCSFVNMPLYCVDITDNSGFTYRYRKRFL